MHFKNAVRNVLQFGQSKNLSSGNGLKELQESMESCTGRDITEILLKRRSTTYNQSTIVCTST